MPYLSASAVVIHYEEALHQVYGPFSNNHLDTGHEILLRKVKICYLGDMTDENRGCDSAEIARHTMGSSSVFTHINWKTFSLKLKWKVHISCVRSCLVSKTNEDWT